MITRQPHVRRTPVGAWYGMGRRPGLEFHGGGDRFGLCCQLEVSDRGHMQEIARMQPPHVRGKSADHGRSSTNLSDGDGAEEVVVERSEGPHGW